MNAWVWRILLLLFAGLVPAVAAEPLPRSVLIFDQSEPHSQWGIGFRAALQATLNADTRKPVTIYSEILDLSRFRGKGYEELLRVYLREKYREKAIGVIVVHGSTALDLLLRLRTELWPSVPVVFGVVDEETVARLQLPSDVTGAIMRLRLSNPVAAARLIVPGLKRIVLVGDPFERQSFRSHYAREVPQFARELEIIDLLGLPVAEIKQRVAALPNDAAIIYGSIYQDGAGVSYIPPNPIGQIAAAANRPVVADAEPQIGHGAIGGFVTVAAPIAVVTADIALRILNGEQASAIPITVGDFTRLIFDWRQLQRFGISESALPAGSEIRYRELTLWEQNRGTLYGIFSILLFQAALIAWLLYERFLRRNAELESRGRLLEVMHLSRTATAGVMSASIAHELNQPLGAILSNAETAEILLGADAPDIALLKEILADIRVADHRAADIIRHLRGLLKKGETELQEFDLNGLIETTLHILGPEAAKRLVTLRANHVNAPLPVRADQIHLQQVVLNLAMNAMDAVQDAGSSKRQLTVQTALTSDSEVEVSVVDTGTGVPKDKLNKIFETFYTTKAQGTGMGLSIARTIIETYGGRIWAENVPAGGAVFRFTLPLVTARPAA